MKTIKKQNGCKVPALVLLLAIWMAFCACGEELPPLWENATYMENTELGSGAKTFYLEVHAQKRGITFTVHTDAEILGTALQSLGLLSGEQGPYGLYVKTVNGMTLDPDAQNAYWALYLGDTYATSGVDDISITEGARYALKLETF